MSGLHLGLSRVVASRGEKNMVMKEEDLGAKSLKTCYSLRARSHIFEVCRRSGGEICQERLDGGWSGYPFLSNIYQVMRCCRKLNFSLGSSCMSTKGQSPGLHMHKGKFESRERSQISYCNESSRVISMSTISHRSSTNRPDPKHMCVKKWGTVFR